MTKQHRLAELSDLLTQLYDAKFSGADGSAHARAQGLVDGYIRALLDMGIAEETEVLALVQSERHKASQRAEKKFSFAHRRTCAQVA